VRFGHHRGQRGLRCAVEQGLGAAEQERSGDQQRHSGQVTSDRERQQPDDHGAAEVHAPQHPLAVPPVDQRAGGQGKQQPWQAARRGYQRQRLRVTGEACREQRQCGEADAVADAGDRGGTPQPPEVGWQESAFAAR
jgi:hypothetical protein